MGVRRTLDCHKHAGQGNHTAREAFDEVLRKLPNNQSGVGRHKCPYCAFEEGIKRGYGDALNAVIEKIAEMEN